jgi:WD40 repeat protein
LSKKTNAHSDYINSVAFSPDGTKIVSGSADNTIKVWDSGAPLALKYAPPWPN